MTPLTPDTLRELQQLMNEASSGEAYAMYGWAHSPEDNHLIFAMRNALPALLDVAERCALAEERNIIFKQERDALAAKYAEMEQRCGEYKYEWEMACERLANDKIRLTTCENKIEPLHLLRIENESTIKVLRSMLAITQTESAALISAAIAAKETAEKERHTAVIEAGDYLRRIHLQADLDHRHHLELCAAKAALTTAEKERDAALARFHGDSETIDCIQQEKQALQMALTTAEKERDVLAAKLARAEYSLKQAGFQDLGAEYWKPPVNEEAGATWRKLIDTEAELAALKQQAKMDTVRFQEMQDSGYKLQAALATAEKELSESRESTHAWRHMHNVLSYTNAEVITEKNKMQAALDRSEGALKERETAYCELMGFIRSTKMKHGLCHPRERKACTACNAQDYIDALLSEWKGAPIYAQRIAKPTAAGGA